MAFGDFIVTCIPSVHSDGLIDDAGKEIIRPLTPPVLFTKYREGGAYSIHIEHPAGSMLIHGSVGHEVGALYNYQADTVFLGIGGLADLSNTAKDNYFNEVVAVVGGKRVIPIHWDNFFKSLKKLPLKKASGFAKSMSYLSSKENIQVKLLQFKQSIVIQ